MRFSDDILMAYASGELGEETRLAVEAAMRRDDSTARRVALLRAQLQAQHPGQYGDPAGFGENHGRSAGTPGAQRPRGASVVQLASVRAQRAATQQAARKAAARPWGWQEWSALALVLVLGVALGRFGLARWQPGWFSEPPPPSHVVSNNGLLTAQGKLAWALSQQMGGAVPSEGEVRVGLSFLSKEGTYCRTFTLVGAMQDLVGIGCRASDEWRIPVLVQNQRPLPQMGAYRMAGTEMPGALLEAIDQRIVGGMLDTRAELEALRRNWQR